MAQNSARLQWTEAEVDGKLKDIMNNAYDLCYSTGARFVKGDESESDSRLRSIHRDWSLTPHLAVPSLVAGANIAGFLKVANAAKATGDWW